MKKNSLLIGAALAVVAAFALGMYFFQTKQTAARVETAAQNTASLVQFYSPSTGANDAKVTIVEFLDPSCEACRFFHPIVKSILAENPGKVRLVIRYAAFHQGSDTVVKMLEAARAQNLYWQALDAAFASQPVWADHGNPQVERVWEFLQPIGLNIEKAKVDMQSPGITAILKQDTADLIALGVNKTPTFYVNGKPLLSIGEGQLRALVQQEIKASYP